MQQIHSLFVHASKQHENITTFTMCTTQPNTRSRTILTLRLCYYVSTLQIAVLLLHQRYLDNLRLSERGVLQDQEEI